MALAIWKNTPNLEDLKADFQAAQSDQTIHENDVKRWLDNLAGNNKINAKKGRSTLVPKLIRKQAEWRYPSLSEPFLGTNDLFNATPKKAGIKESAQQNEMILNYQFSHQINKVRFIDEYVRACTDEGTVIVKVGWDFEEKENKVEYRDEFGNIVIQSEFTTIKNEPTVEVCKYDSITIDPTCEGHMKRAQFGVHSFETSLSELKKDGRYSNLENINLSSTSNIVIDSNNETSSFEFKDDARKKFIVREYHGFWDYNDTGIAEQFICTWANNIIIRLEESPYPFKRIPFVSVQYLPVRNSNHGQPDGELLEDNQKVVGAVTRGIIDLMGRSANGQQGSQKGALDSVNARKFENGEDYKFNRDIDPRQAFQMGVYPEIPRSAMEMIMLQNNEAESLTGVKAFNQGISGTSLGDSVGGIRSAMDATAKREMGILRRLGNGVVEIGHLVMKMNQEWLSDEEIYMITGEEVVIRREDLAGEYDITLNVSTPEADAEKARGLEFMLQTLGNSLPFEFTQILLSDIAKLKKQPELAMRISQYQQQPNQLAQERVMLEMELLKAQIRNENAKGIENETDIGLKRAKTVTEQAKARDLNSGADRKDLDFVETEGGTSHARELEKRNNDSNNKTQEKVLDALIADEQSAGAVGDMK